jgi:hypothetical protein
MRFNFLLFSLLVMLHYNTNVQACIVVAKVQAENAEDISILRNMMQRTLKQTGVELCVNDIVTIPDTVAKPVILHYYSEDLQQKELVAGEQYEITGLDAACGNWCRLTRKTKRLYILLTRRNVTPPERIVATDRGDNEAFPTSTLIANKPQPLYLFAEPGDIGFFWKGGKAPYQFMAKNAQGQMVVNQAELYDKHTSFNVDNVESGQIYHIILQDKQNNTLETAIEFRLPPFPLNPDENKLLRLTRLLRDTERNWRLEVWRQLQTFADNPKVNKFKAHLIVDNF